ASFAPRDRDHALAAGGAAIPPEPPARCGRTVPRVAAKPGALTGSQRRIQLRGLCAAARVRELSSPRGLPAGGDSAAPPGSVLPRSADLCGGRRIERAARHPGFAPTERSLRRTDRTLRPAGFTEAAGPAGHLPDGVRKCTAAAGVGRLRL